MIYCRSLQKGRLDNLVKLTFIHMCVSLFLRFLFFCLVFFPLAGSSSSFCVSLWPKHGQLAYVEHCNMNNIDIV